MTKKYTFIRRTMLMTAAVTALLSASWAMYAYAGPGHDATETHESFSAGQPGDAKSSARTIQVSMKENEDGTMAYSPDKIEVKQGEQIRFVITNTGEVTHEFVLASTDENLEHAEEMKKNPEMEHDAPNMITLEPKAKTEVLWDFSKGGTFEFACLIPGHRELGMLGHVTVAGGDAATQASESTSDVTPADEPQSDAIADEEFTTGEVKKINEAAGKITLKHGPIKKFDMGDGMTMVFKAQDPAMLSAVKPGDKVKFVADKINGQFTVTKIEKTE